MKEEEETRAEELRYGQIVIVTARWALVLMGLLLLIWRPGDLRGFTIGILVVLALAVVNFFLHVQILRDRPIARRLAYGMSLADLVVISLIVITGEGAGFTADTFVFYYPAVLAYSLVFPAPIGLLLYGRAHSSIRPYFHARAYQQRVKSANPRHAVARDCRRFIFGILVSSCRKATP